MKGIEMTGPEASSPNRDIRNFLMVLGSAMGGALLLVFFMVYYYGPPGTYVAGNVLLAPSTLKVMSFQEKDPLSGKMTNYVFDRVEFYAQSPHTGVRESRVLSLEEYGRLYKLIQSERSLPKMQGSDAAALGPGGAIGISILMKPQSRSPSQSQGMVFQQAEFSVSGDLFRVEVDDDALGGKVWVFFSYPRVGQAVMKALDGER